MKKGDLITLKFKDGNHVVKIASEITGYWQIVYLVGEDRRSWSICIEDLKKMVKS